MGMLPRNAHRRLFEEPKPPEPNSILNDLKFVEVSRSSYKYVRANPLPTEEDGDEVFVPLTEVRCCVLGFKEGRPVYSKLVKMENSSGVWAVCEKCRGSYGLWPKGGIDYAAST